MNDCSTAAFRQALLDNEQRSSDLQDIRSKFYVFQRVLNPVRYTFKLIMNPYRMRSFQALPLIALAITVQNDLHHSFIYGPLRQISLTWSPSLSKRLQYVLNLKYSQRCCRELVNTLDRQHVSLHFSGLNATLTSSGRSIVSPNKI